jgi:hypothetical protein
MHQVRLYDNPQEFAEMMVRHLSDSLNLQVHRNKADPLLFEIIFDSAKDEKAEVSLHSTFLTYMRTGDMNTAIDYLNGIISCSEATRNQAELMSIDCSRIYPALRDEAFVEQAGLGCDLLTEDSIPGLRVVFLEVKSGYSKIMNKTMVDLHPKLTEERVKRLAYRNLRSEGWTPPRLTLRSPFRGSCFIETFLDNPFPLECQFLQPEMAQTDGDSSYLIAFANRNTTLLMRSEERMETYSSACLLAKKSRFTEVVRRSYRVMPHPVSPRIFWSYKGAIHHLDGL